MITRGLGTRDFTFNLSGEILLGEVADTDELVAELAEDSGPED